MNEQDCFVHLTEEQIAQIESEQEEWYDWVEEHDLVMEVVCEESTSKVSKS